MTDLVPASNDVPAWLAMSGISAEQHRTAAAASAANQAIAVAIVGRMASGKDTVGNLVTSAYDAVHGRRDWMHHKIGDFLRHDISNFATVLRGADGRELMAAELGCGVSDIDTAAEAIERLSTAGVDAWDRTPDVRTALQEVGTLREAQDPLWSARRTFREIVTVLAGGGRLISTDIRRPSEAAAAKAAGTAVFGLSVSRAEQRRRISKRDGFCPDPSALDHPTERIAVDAMTAHAVAVYDTEAATPQDIAEDIVRRSQYPTAV